jgi:arylsulfatase A-like enzyme
MGVKLRALGVALGAVLIGAPVASFAQSDALDRSVLPIPEPPRPVYTELNARNATPPPRFEVRAPEGAPNDLIVILDDMGFGQSSAFGGPIHMPTVEALANDGLRYNEFHTTALCSPTRVALLTGRNHHMNNMGGITEIATAFPGNTGQRPNAIAPLAEMLRLNGYSTAAFGKSHETAAWETSVSGPTDRWPTRSGFDRFYGFIGGETNQWHPSIFKDMTPVEPPHDPHYHFMTDMTNQAIDWVRSEKSLTPDKPFFIYFAPGAVHAPLHVPREWIEKYRGKFDQGWDKVREETLARQKALGVVPPNTVLAPKPTEIKDWASLSDDEKRLFAREMEVFAGFGEYADTEIGRLVSAIDELGQLDNTLVFYIIGDNGASAEGGMNGLFNEATYFNQVPEHVEDILKHIDELGGPSTYPHYAAGWAVAGDTPFTWTKQIASSYGGTRNGLVVHWPKGIESKNEVRSQWHHVIDVAPTILETAGLPEPKSVDGTPQIPIQGVSMVYSFDDPQAKDRHLTQYFEIAGNRAIYHDGWLAGTIHRAPWEYAPRHKLADDVWELYDTRSDFSLTHDVAALNPDKLEAMQDLFIKEAIANHVLPIDDRTVERFDPKTAGRPDLMAGRTSLTLYPGMSVNENSFINLKNVSHTITTEVEIPGGGANGVILTQGGRFGGWSFYLKDGKPTYEYNWLGLDRYKIAADKPLPAGKATVQFDFTYDGGGLGKGGTGRIFVNGEKVAEGRIDKTQCCIIALDENADVGKSNGTPVSPDYENPFAFTGTIDRVVVDLTPGADATSAEARKAEDEAKLKRATVEE